VAGKASTAFSGPGRGRPLADLGDFLQAVAEGSLEAAAKASNAQARVMVTRIRSELPTRRLRSRAGGTMPRRSGGTMSRKRTGTGVNYGYLEADADMAKFRPTALIVGRGPVHLLENPIAEHSMVRGVRRGPDGRIMDWVPRAGGAEFGVGRRRAFGPQLSAAGISSTFVRTRHPGVKRTSGPFERGFRASFRDGQKAWQQVFRRESLRVKGF
jgi:hypothetical protein